MRVSAQKQSSILDFFTCTRPKTFWYTIDLLYTVHIAVLCICTVYISGLTLYKQNITIACHSYCLMHSRLAS